MTASEFVEMWSRFLATEYFRVSLTGTKPMEPKDLLYFGAPQEQPQNIKQYLDSIVFGNS